MLKLFTGLLVVGLFVSALADTPANCTYEDIRGTWMIHEGPRGQTKDVVCNDSVNVTSSKIVHLEFPNNAVDEKGNVGFWTIIYNQGFELVIDGRKYFAFSYYKGAKSYCGLTFWGWSHETGVNASNWSCYSGVKLNASEPKLTKIDKVFNRQKMVQLLHQKTLYEKNLDFVEAINNRQSSWTATHYPFMEQMTIADLINRTGGKKSAILGKPKPAPVDKKTELLASQLPDSFDWRNVSGVSYVSPVRDQGGCGSCYAFASMALNEARLRIKTKNQKQNIFSPNDIVECSEYSQGCDGGFAYLIAGKYGEDFGLVEESCNPYREANAKCHTKKTCARWYTTNYHYVGGFYGACNEALMRIELVNNGPMEVAFEVYDDFMNYQGGIYHHTGLKDTKNFKFAPFELTNHAVLLVGYGADKKTGEKFWIVKNSWGSGWGENGFFRIRRDTDECAIESMAVAADIVV